MADPTTTATHPATLLVPDHEPDHELDDARVRRHALQSRHTHALAKLLEERNDLRGVHALADLVADSLRWSA